MFWDPRKAGSRPHSPRNRRPPPRNRMCPSRVSPWILSRRAHWPGCWFQGWAFVQILARGADCVGFRDEFSHFGRHKILKSRLPALSKADARWYIPLATPRVFAKGICQGHLLGVAFSGSLRTGSIGALCAVAKSVSAFGFLEGAQDFIAGWSSPVARQAHNLKVIGSNPIPATKLMKNPSNLKTIAGVLFWRWNPPQQLGLRVQITPQPRHRIG